MEFLRKNTISLRLDFDFANKKLTIHPAEKDDVVLTAENPNDQIFLVKFSDIFENSEDPRFLENLLFAACIKLQKGDLGGMKNTSWENLVSHFRADAESGDAEAMNTLAGLLAEQSVVVRDMKLLEEAEKWFKAAAEKHHVKAMIYLADVWPTAKAFYRDRIEPPKGQGL
ncbi:sel1 repeat family protein [Massilia violaceinigra]|uniref:Sel1 repeat family protein n=1 Tax=Massilia violaceinigra TaxID=2045208 RepID=A0ABY4AD88_9BURK|nr:hypothetical protein [Massilia violaceinigra]UOD31541.1 sel1 repeat family protein [Massilia violaceinigra]